MKSFLFNIITMHWRISEKHIQIFYFKGKKSISQAHLDYATPVTKIVREYIEQIIILNGSNIKQCNCY